jgi:hypothetical protein
VWYNGPSPDVLSGMIVKTIDIDEDSDRILIITECGRSFTFEHHQDCCESVVIHDTIGNPKVLEGKKLVSVTHAEDGGIPDDVNITPYESWTWTEITFKTDEHTVISRWIGESNGYYSESVDFSELK